MFFSQFFSLVTNGKSGSVAGDKVWAWTDELTTKRWHEMTRKSGRASSFGGMSKQRGTQAELSELHIGASSRPSDLAFLAVATFSFFVVLRSYDGASCWRQDLWGQEGKRKKKKNL